MRSTTTLLLLATLSAALPLQTEAETLSLADLAPGDLAITEYLANPVGVADSEGEYFEILNTRGAAVDLAGMVVRDDGSNAFTVDALILPPGAFGILGNGNGADLGLAVDYVYGSAMSLTNGADEIVLIGAGDQTLFRLSYTDGDGFGAGVAAELDLLSPGLVTTVDGDYIAATSPLLLDNLGSPGAPGGTRVPTVPLPGAAWLLATGFAWLACIGQRRRHRCATRNLANNGEAASCMQSV